MPVQHPALVRRDRAVEDEHLKNESAFRKQATALKKQKRYDEAVRFLRLAREEQYKTDFQYDMQTLLRVPKYLMLAGRYDEAVLELKDLLAGKWITNAGSWLSRDVFDRQMVLDVLLEAAQNTGDEVLVKYCQEESSRFENDIVRARVEDVKMDFRKTYERAGTDLGVISGGCGFDDQPCAKWHGFVVSVLGKTEGWPTMDDVDAVAIFHPDTYHRIDYLNPLIDEELIMAAKRRQG